MDLFDLLRGRNLKHIYLSPDNKVIRDGAGNKIASIHPERRAWIVYPRPLLPSGDELGLTGMKIEVSASGRLLFSINSLPITVY